ncbi:hypothetical protein FRC04_001374 [Tulasnella sp. 424]|nr:hypothetical protein FRC04_001374 [Tulasnella sp. 424]KAG8968812.1 hypothetical protein FRC05_001298 [Tulasnella sp. 425]
MHSLIRSLLSTILLLALSQQAASQSVIVSTSFSQAITFTGNRVLATVSVPIPITVTVGGASPAATGGASASGNGGTVVTVGGSQAVSNGGVVTVGASQASGAASGAASASSTPSTTYPAAPATTVDPNSVAPYPGQTNAAGQQLGPDDNYHAAGFRTVESGIALVGTLAAIVVGGAQLVHLL